MICPRCGAPTSDLEPFCEKCGWPLPRRIGWGVLLAVLLMLPGLALGAEQQKKEFKILAGATWTCQDGGTLRVQDEPYLGWAPTILKNRPEIKSRHDALTVNEEKWIQEAIGPALPVRVYERTGEKALVWDWCKPHECYRHSVYEGYDLNTGQLFIEITDDNLTVSESLRATKEGVYIRAAETGDYGEYRDRIQVRTLGEATPTIQAAIRCAKWIDAQEQAKTVRR